MRIGKASATAAASARNEEGKAGKEQEAEGGAMRLMMPQCPLPHGHIMISHQVPTPSSGWCP